MASTYSTNLRIELMADGENSNTWGGKTNTNLTMLEQAVSGVASVAMTDADYILTTSNAVADEARNAVITMTGTLTQARNVIVPSVDKVYVFKNSTTGGFAVTVKTSGGTGISVANGETETLYCDATNVLRAITTPTGTGAPVRANSPTLVTPNLGTPASGTLTNCTGLPTAGLVDEAVTYAKMQNVSATDKLLGRSTAGSGDVEEITCTAFARSILDDADAAAQRATLGSSIVGDAVFVAASQAAAQAALGITASGGSEESLTGFYHPAAGSAYQDCYRAGFLPSWFNQQWGGAQWGMLPDGSFGSVATGSIEDNGLGNVSQAAGNYYIAQGFKVSNTATFDSVWVKIYKTGNPTYNITARVYTDSAGSPSAATGSAATVAAKTLTSKTDGEWVQFTGLAAALTAGTQYHIVLSSLAAFDVSNYFSWKLSSGAKKYPHGNYNAGTSAPSWTPATTTALCFLVQNPAANSIIQSGGMFDYKLSFAAGSPVNQSRAVAQPLANFYDGKSCSVLYRGTFAVSSNVWDFCYGLDHDRITLTINASGYPVLSVYRSDRALVQVTGTGSVTSGDHDVGIRVRTAGDGADYATLYVDGVSVGTPITGATFTMAAEMVRLGTARLGDGFGLAPTWTQDMQMTSLPSAQGWTWAGTGTEANCMSVSGGKLYQDANGYTSTQTGYYTKTIAAVNSTGSTVVTKLRVASSPNSVSTTIGSTPVFIQLQDGSKDVKVSIEEYFLRTGSGATTDFTIQGDFKSQEHIFTLCAKGSDYYLYIDGKLVVDGTGKFVSATANNLINVCDGSATASDNADARWSYVKYYQDGMILPTAATATCSEFAHWSGDKSALYATLWNSGTPVSVKETCGVPRNYQFEQVVQREVRSGIASATTSSPTNSLVADMDAYVIGNAIEASFWNSVANATDGNQITTFINVDGVYPKGTKPYIHAVGASEVSIVTESVSKVVPLGLHKVEGYFGSPNSTTVISTLNKELVVGARSQS